MFASVPYTAAGGPPSGKFCIPGSNF